MKQLLIVLALTLSSQFVIAEEHAVKQVCVDVKKDGKDVIDPKTQKVKQMCKQVKEHKKLDGHDVPVKK